ncbi:MAG: ricin-type beta-trefoil lectin domain protein [Microthrixaceae bacterium]|nr:ricin-type beta-trefoil lectin domain protein [Microthrixaceae bacterium]
MESLVATLLLSVMGVALLSALFTSISSSGLHRRLANAEVVARNFTDALTSAPYVPCATAGDYASPPSFSAISRYEIEIGQTDTSKPAVEFLVPGTDPPSFGADCAPVADTGLPDRGLQRIWYKVVFVNGSSREVVRSGSTLKPYDGTVDKSFGPVPAGGVRCTITAGQDASLSESAPTVADGTSESMNVSGSATTRYSSLVKIPLVPGSTPCAEGGTVPVNMQVRSATLRLYTWQVSGNVDCATSCWHVLKRVASSWTENSVTWATKPPVLAAGYEMFQHGTGTGETGPRFQMVSGPNIAADVASFYALPSANQGWAIDQACPPDFPGRTCDTPNAAFRMRTREWGIAAQRPQLSVVFGPSLTTQKQIRNVAFGTCASVFDNDDHNGALVVAQTCAGKGWQAWTLDAQSRFAGLNTVDNCMETGNSSAGKPNVIMWDCDGPDGGVYDDWQMWTVDGAAIRYTKDPSKCLEIRDGNQAIGTGLTIDTCDGSPEQQWAVEPLIPAPPPSPPVRLRNVGGGNCADQDIRATDNGPIPQNWMQGFPCLGPDRVVQTFVPMADGRLVNLANPSFCLDGTSGAVGAQVTLDNCHQGANQQWIQVTGGLIRNLKNNLCLEGGSDVQWFRLRACDASKAVQQWVVEPATSPSLADVGQLRNVGSGGCVEPLATPGNGVDTVEVPCDLSRTAQTYIRLGNGEFRPTSRLSQCLHTEGGSLDKDLDHYSCDQMPDNNIAANNHQKYDLTTPEKLMRNRKNSYCVQSLGFGTTPETKSCDAGLASQKWEFGTFGNSSMARQLRNVGRSSCLEGVNNSDNGAAMWPCSGESRKSQEIAVVVMSEAAGVQTVELRKVDNINTCLDLQSSGSVGARSEWKGCSGSSYQRWKIGPTSTSGQVRIESVAVANRCITGFGDRSLATVQTCDDSVADKRWVIETPTDSRTIVQIRNKATGGCLDVRGAMAQNTRMTDFPCLGAERPTQSFLRLNSGRFASTVDLGLCLDRYSATNFEEPLAMWGCDRPAADQQFTTTGDVLKTSGDKCEELIPASNSVRQRTCAASNPNKDLQTWYVEPVSVNDAAPPLQFRNSAGWCLDAVGGSAVDAVQAIPCLGASRHNQAFAFSGDGALVRLRTNPTMCLDSQAAGVGSNGARDLIVYACDPANVNQKWTFDGSGRLRNTGTSPGWCAQGGGE